MSLAVTNPDPVPLTRIWLRLWGNGLHGCSRSAVRVSAVTGATAGAPAVRCTAVPLDLAAALAPGARGTVELDVDIRAPDDFDRFGEGGHRLALFSNALPALAHREGGRWRLDRHFGSARRGRTRPRTTSCGRVTSASARAGSSATTRSTASTSAPRAPACASSRRRSRASGRAWACSCRRPCARCRS